MKFVVTLKKLNLNVDNKSMEHDQAKVFAWIAKLLRISPYPASIEIINEPALADKPGVMAAFNKSGQANS